MFPVGDEGTPPPRGLPIVNLTIIAINILVFLWQQAVGLDYSVMAYGAIPYEITHGVDLVGNEGGLPQQAIGLGLPVFITLLTSMFMHGGWLHIGGNMLFLFIFGDNVEDNMGHVKYAIFYLLCGFCASFAQILIGSDSTVPGVGASGAIAGVMAAYLVLFPQASIRIVSYYGGGRVPAIVMIGLWGVLQLISGLGVLGVEPGGGVAYWAHIGGFVTGLLLVFVFGNRGAGQGIRLGQFGR